MSWSSATEIMDRAIQAADEAAIAVLRFYGPELGLKKDITELAEEEQATVDEALRPHVKAISDRLQEQDWEPESKESAYFHRFPQEMIGYDDNAYEGWLRHQLSEATHEGTPEDILAAAQVLKAHTDKMKAGNTS